MKIITLENLSEFKKRLENKIPKEILDSSCNTVGEFMIVNNSPVLKFTQDVGGGNQNQGTITSITYNRTANTPYTVSQGAISIPGKPIKITRNGTTLTISSCIPIFEPYKITISSSTGSKMNMCDRLGISNNETNNKNIARNLHYDTDYIANGTVYRGDYITLNGINYVLCSGTTSGNMLFIANSLQGTTTFNSGTNTNTYFGSTIDNYVSGLNILDFTPSSININDSNGHTAARTYFIPSKDEITNNTDIITQHFSDTWYWSRSWCYNSGYGDYFWYSGGSSWSYSFSDRTGSSGVRVAFVL